MTLTSKAEKVAERKARDDYLIDKAFNTSDPNFAYICGGLRRISVDPTDQRVRRMLLRRGVRYVSKNQMIIFACAHYLPVDLFMDIGVNYAECMLSLPLNYGGRVIGYEANPSLLGFIRRSVDYNDDIHDVQICNFAMSSISGEQLTFYVNPQWSGMSSMIADPSKTDLIPVDVITTSIDHEVEKVRELSEIKLLLAKIDVEGYETEVLSGGVKTESSIPNIIYLMEFDSKYIARGGVSPESFFYDLTTRFGVYEFLRGRLKKVADYESIRNRGGDSAEHIHLDLILTKFSDESARATFKANLVDKSVRELVEALWLNV